MEPTDKTSNYRIDLVTGPVKDAGYRVYKVSWQTHRNNKPVKPGKRRKRRPRWKLISVHGRRREAEDAIVKYCVESCEVKVLSIDYLGIELEFKNGAKITISSDDIHFPLQYEFKAVEEYQRS